MSTSDDSSVVATLALIAVGVIAAIVWKFGSLVRHLTWTSKRAGAC